MTYKELQRILREGGIEYAERKAAILFCKYSGVCEASLPFASDFDSPELRDAVSRVLDFEPLQYVLGECEFYREKYFLSRDCLIPRPDTEIIVEYAINNLPKDAYFVDLCTGSGCIAISILANRPDCHALACDISLGALEMARKNAKENGVSARIELIHADVLKGAPDGIFDAVISNPPYIRSDVLPTLSREVRGEPMAALDGGEDGMTFYNRIVEEYKDKIKENGFLLFETGYDQRQQIQSLAYAHGLLCECLDDFGGNHRGAVLRASK